LALTGCVDATPGPVETSAPAPIGPVPVAAGPLTLQQVVAIVGEDDGTGATSFSAGTEFSTSGDDLASENDYWVGNGGNPAQCAGVVSAPYMVSAHDTGARLDDPSVLVGTFTELDEDRLGLIQVYARQFDDAATASMFLDEFTATVKGCPAYQLVDGDTVTFDAVKLKVSALKDLPPKLTGLHYVETVHGPGSDGVTVTFLQRDGVVISIYGELTSSSTITQDDVDAIAAKVATRLSQL
ncbi:MAG: hypothetical protein ABI632_05585, partial [Pseudolysinimonas sp.]